MDAKKVQTKLKNISKKTNMNRALKKLEKVKAERRIAKTNRQKIGGNPITRKLAQHREKSIKKHEVKLRKMEAEAQAAEQNPKLAMQRANAENKIALEKAKYRNKTASATAIATGAAALGRGLSDERNQDDSKDRDLELQKIKTIFNNSDNTAEDSETGLSQGVY